MVNEVFILNGKSMVFNEQQAIFERYAMDNLLSYDHHLNYQDFIAFKEMLFTEEKEALDQDCFLAMHRARLYSKYHIELHNTAAEAEDR